MNFDGNYTLDDPPIKSANRWVWIPNSITSGVNSKTRQYLSIIHDAGITFNDSKNEKVSLLFKKNSLIYLIKTHRKGKRPVFNIKYYTQNLMNSKDVNKS